MSKTLAFRQFVCRGIARPQRLIFIFTAAYMMLALLYSLASPIFEVSDELWHFPVVKYLADNDMRLPPQDSSVNTPWRQQGSQPPLYYLLAAALVRHIDTTDMEWVRRVNPHPDIGLVHPDGNVNMIVHRGSIETFPWRGTTLAVHITRFFSVLLGLGTVLVTYFLAREVFPDRQIVTWLAVGLNAFLPMFLFISGSVNNDNLSNFLGNLLTLLVVKLLKAKVEPKWSVYLSLGVASGMGLISKLSIGFFMPLLLGALIVISLRIRNWRPVIRGGITISGLSLLIAGWWYWRNWQLYRDPTGLNTFLTIVGRRAYPAGIEQLWAERESFLRAFWGFFGGMNLPLPDAVYQVFNVIGGIGLLGAIGFIIFTLVHRQWSLERWFVALVTIVWPLGTFLAYLRWTAETPASQGRLLFVAVSSICLWIAVGLTWWLPPRLQLIICRCSLAYSAGVASVVPFLVIVPAYMPSSSVPLESSLGTYLEPGGGQIDLQAAQLLTRHAQPGQYIDIQTQWAIESPVTRDWSLFVHLVSPEGIIVGQRDVYPAQGKLASSDLPLGYAWEHPISVWIPQTAYSPTQLAVRLGWYHLPSGERLALSNTEDTFSIGQVSLRPRNLEVAIPNPINVNFVNQIELVGYSLSTMNPIPGESFTLALYWRALASMRRDYTAFAHLIDPSTETIYAASDVLIGTEQKPSSTWKPGDVVEDKYTLSVDPLTPPGLYEFEVGLYFQDPGGSLSRLRIIDSQGGMANNFVYLSRLFVAPD